MNSEDDASVILNEEQFLELEKLAGIGYSLKKIAMYFGLSYRSVKLNYDLCLDPEPGSIRYHFERGQLLVQANIDKQAVDKATDGNLTAMQIYLKQKEKNDLRDLKEQILNGHR